MIQPRIRADGRGQTEDSRPGHHRKQEHQGNQSRFSPFLADPWLIRGQSSNQIHRRRIFRIFAVVVKAPA